MDIDNHCLWAVSLYLMRCKLLVVCYFQRGAYLVFVRHYILLKELVGLILVVVCYLLSIKNVRHLRHARVLKNASLYRTGPEVHVISASAGDRQLILMVYLNFFLCNISPISTNNTVRYKKY